MDIQKIIDDINEKMKIESGKEYNLGNLIDDLEKYKDSIKHIEFDDGSIPTDFDSWRGSYSELALGYKENGNEFAVSIWRKAYDSNGNIFEGYKGGEFEMDRNTPIHQANYGCCGTDEGDRKIIGIKEDGEKVIILTRLEEE